MKQQTKDLIGQQLDCAVAKALGRLDGINELRSIGGVAHISRQITFSDAWEIFNPSECWAFGGPIIEREHIAIAELRRGEWYAVHPESDCAKNFCGLLGDHSSQGYMDFSASDCTTRGPTPLIAAMRAYVASKFGEEVEL